MKAFKRHLTDGSTRRIARERLSGMLECTGPEISPEHLRTMKKEIADVVLRYLPADPDSYEVKIELKQKRA